MKKIIGILIISAFLGMSCSEEHATLDVGTHPAEWLVSGSDQFHGKYATQVGVEGCQSCHGANYQGGESGVSCYTCHASFPHPDNFLVISSENFHGKYLKNSLGWNLNSCQRCHGEDYAGGSSGLSCKTSGCHTQSSGPQACNTCHGDFNTPGRIAPPKDLDDNTSHTAVGVGAHQEHVRNTEITNTYRCSTCHPSLTGFNDPNHINLDIPNAQMMFSTLATDDGRLSVTWNHGTATCANVYCHGWFEFSKADAPSSHQFAYTGDVMVGKQVNVVWTSEAGNCDFCHGLPPAGHIASSLDQCFSCHGSVVNVNGVIINKDLHINGQVDVFN